MAEPFTENPLTNQQELIKEYQDRLLDTQRIVPYDLLASRGKLEQSTDPEAQIYLRAKETFQKGYKLCLSIPRSLEDDVLSKHEQEIKAASETMVNAWMLDDRATHMSERILILGQQYEKVLLKDIPEEKKDGYFIKESIMFSSWILLAGKQYKHCITTLSLAIDTYPDLPARVFYIRASCQVSLGRTRLAIKDLERSLEKNTGFSIVYSILGSVYLSLNDREKAQKNFRRYLQKGHPDTSDTINALYALSVLVNYYKKGKREAQELYLKAKVSEERFLSLYGTHTGLHDIKREAIKEHESPEEAQRLIEFYINKEQVEQKMQRLIASGFLAFASNPDRCSHCGASHAKENKPLLACGACKSVWYCSRDCQVSDYKLNHKAQCKDLKASKMAT
ncbi:hypothetical protein G6F56_009010 [Rhizopus delemar]|nr:hypothetical protein G6F56_009010 [Rhizopus delemar]